MSKLAAQHPDVTFLLVNCEPDKSRAAVQAFAEANSATAKELVHLQLKAEKSPYSGYYPYHVVFKDGVCVMSGGFDSKKKAWKDWESVAGLKSTQAKCSLC